MGTNISNRWISFLIISQKRVNLYVEFWSKSCLGLYCIVTVCDNQGCGVGVVENFNDSDSDSGKTFCAHQLWLFVPQTCVSVTLGNVSSLTLQQEMIMAIQKGGSALTCIPSLRGHSRSAASLGLITHPALSQCNSSGLVSLKFPFALSGLHYRCSVTLATQQWMRVLMGARPLLRNARHRTMITPVNTPSLRLIHISPSYQTVYRSFEIILEWVLSIGLEFKSNVLCKRIASKNIQSDMN